MLDALQRIDEVKKTIDSKVPVFFFDYDGTLTPIVAKPEAAVLSQQIRHCLEMLSQQYFIAIVSGRQLSDVKERVALESIYYAGNHGLEVAGPDYNEVREEIDDNHISLVEEIRQELSLSLKHLQNVSIEDKHYSLTLHLELANDATAVQAEAILDATLKSYPALTKLTGKKILEVRPMVNWNKGHVILYLLSKLRLSFQDFLPIYIGDDTSDEDAFRAIQNKGLGILVSENEKPSAANYNLNNPSQVHLFLQEFINE